jgi:OmpA-OmpF porin, OOP family
MQKNILTTMISIVAGVMLASSASAMDKGVYLGGILGWGDVHQAGFSDFPQNSFKDTGLAGRVFAGYKFNDYVALESGFTQFSNMNANGSGYDSDGNFTTVSGTVKTFAVDLVAKGILPLQHGFSLFGTLGIAYVDQYASVNLQSQTPMGGVSLDGDETQTQVAPTFGLGASYAITQNIDAQVSWSHIQAVSNDNNTTGNTDLVGLGLTYNFG